MSWEEELERGRAFCRTGAWLDAYQSLSRADGLTPLDREDLELLATAAYMIGRESDFISYLERTHQLHLDAGAALRAARSAVWIGLVLTLQFQMGPASGWFGRARRLVERLDADCVERGYLLVPVILQQVSGKEWASVWATAAEAASIAERFGDRDLFALALHEQGHALVRQGRSAEGFALLDEAMLAAVRRELSPLVTGLVYCGVIAYCRELHDLRRAAEWTGELERWCHDQPQMVNYTGQCLVHRAEIMQTRGAWAEALEEARRAYERFMETTRHRLAGYARYHQGELHRLRGEVDAAEEAYREASRLGFEPQPGLALLRLAQGDIAAAVASIRRALVETSEPLDRGPLLPAYVEILLAAGDVESARVACAELERIVQSQPGEVLEAMAAEANGAVALAANDGPAALASLRRAWQLWHALEAPYESARVRVRIGLACRVLGDDDAATLELEASRDTFARLGATTDLDRLEALIHATPADAGGGLTPRELQVLRLVAAGQTNRAIAAELALSVRTVDRHVSNILTKLGVDSRAAATAYAYEHNLL
jgi:DNA-binding CsgD family transcriptional regulator